MARHPTLQSCGLSSPVLVIDTASQSASPSIISHICNSIRGTPNSTPEIIDTFDFLLSHSWTELITLIKTKQNSTIVLVHHADLSEDFETRTLMHYATSIIKVLHKSCADRVDGSRSSGMSIMNKSMLLFGMPVWTQISDGHRNGSSLGLDVTVKKARGKVINDRVGLRIVSSGKIEEFAIEDSNMGGDQVDKTSAGANNEKSRASNKNTSDSKKSNDSIPLKASNNSMADSGDQKESQQVQIVNRRPKATQQEPQDPETFLSSLSFNLSLTDEQKRQKENMTLPYFTGQNLNSNFNVVEKKETQIYYEMDGNDSWDEDDPDADLDF